MASKHRFIYLSWPPEYAVAQKLVGTAQEFSGFLIVIKKHPIKMASAKLLDFFPNVWRSWAPNHTRCAPLGHEALEWTIPSHWDR